MASASSDVMERVKELTSSIPNKKGWFTRDVNKLKPICSQALLHPGNAWGAIGDIDKYLDKLRDKSDTILSMYEELQRLDPAQSKEWGDKADEFNDQVVQVERDAAKVKADIVAACQQKQAAGEWVPNLTYAAPPGGRTGGGGAAGQAAGQAAAGVALVGAAGGGVNYSADITRALKPDTLSADADPVTFRQWVESLKIYMNSTALSSLQEGERRALFFKDYYTLLCWLR